MAFKRKNGRKTTIYQAHSNWLQAFGHKKSFVFRQFFNSLNENVFHHIRFLVQPANRTLCIKLVYDFAIDFYDSFQLNLLRNRMQISLPFAFFFLLPFCENFASLFIARRIIEFVLLLVIQCLAPYSNQSSWNNIKIRFLLHKRYANSDNSNNYDYEKNEFNLIF